MQIVYNLYLNNTGYSIAAQENINSLISVNTDFDIKTIFLNNISNGVSLERKNIFHALNKKPDSSEKCIIYHSIPPRYRRPQGYKKFIGFCLFETMNPPKNWIDTINEMDVILTASEFNKRVFQTNGVTKPIYVIQHPFDNKMFNKNIDEGGRYEKFTFMSIGTFKQRKNWPNLIKGFYQAFNNKDNVCLFIKTDKNKEINNLIKDIKTIPEFKTKDTPPIYLEENSCMFFEDIPAFMKKADVYVCPSLGEGFNIPAAHAMALNIPIVITKYSGMLEYAKSDFCSYIEPKTYKTIPVLDNIPQFTNCIWPVVNPNDIATALYNVFENYNEAKLKAIKGYDFIHGNFTYEKIGHKLNKVLNEILS